VGDEEKVFSLKNSTNFPQADKPIDIAGQDVTPFMDTPPSGWCFRPYIQFLTIR